MSLPVLVTVAVLFLIVFAAVCFTAFHLKVTPVRVAAVIIAMGTLVTAMAPVVRLLTEPRQPAPLAAPAPPVPGFRQSPGRGV
ncbi:hypothetical protein OG599_06140 [Streptomyces sp. NBC_01335]|uniref:hypothetical protein n=1 Tax=Streptomyces sp. NBC_01335 TaxID=2903828 RepID=UPI002E14D887|nr:hypothetical protein OG599_06140 [Streptomyces sp. NBC_01335]